MTDNTMKISTHNQRFTINKEATGISVKLAAHREWFHILFLICWLGGWAYGEITVLQTLLAKSGNEAGLFEVFWLCGWSIAGIYTITSILWQLVGSEIISVSGNNFSQRIQILGMGITKNFLLNEIKDMRSVFYEPNIRKNQKAHMPPLFGAGYGAIAFDYGSRTMYIGASVDETEAKKIIAAIHRYLPQDFS